LKVPHHFSEALQGETAKNGVMTARERLLGRIDRKRLGEAVVTVQARIVVAR